MTSDVLVTEEGPLRGPCRLQEFICERRGGEGIQISVTNATRAANDSVVVHFYGDATDVRIVAIAEAKQKCR